MSKMYSIAPTLHPTLLYFYRSLENIYSSHRVVMTFNSLREHMSSFSIYSSGSHCCGMNKILPADHFSSFLIQHYYQQRHVSWTPTYSTDYELHQNAREINCWNGIKAATLKDSSNSPPFLNYSVIAIPGQ